MWPLPRLTTTSATDFLKPDPLVFLSAGALVLVWPPYGLTWLGWVALVPFLIVVERAKSPLRAAVQGQWLALAFGLGVLAPVARAFGTYQDLGAWGGGLAALIAALIFQLVWPVFAALRHRWPRSATVGAAALYTGLDALIPKPFGDTLGLAYYEHAWLRQCADLGGPWVLTFVILVVNETVHRSWAEGVDRHRSRWVTAGVLVGLATVYGAMRHAQWSAREAELPGLSVAVVQGNLPLEVRRQAATGDDASSTHVLDAYLRASTEATAYEPDLIVWPETTYPGLYRQPFTESQAHRNVQVDAFVQRHQQPLALGSYLGDDEGVQYNAIVALSPVSGSPGPPNVEGYRKRELLPFGETVPLLGDGDLARRWFPHVSFFGRGPGPSTLRMPLRASEGEPDTVVLGPTVCYEDLFVRIPLAEADLGAEVLLNVSHDGWFGPHFVRSFHLAHAVFRSVEARRPQIRAATSGISALLSATGDPIATGPALEAVVVRGRIARGLSGTSPVGRLGSSAAIVVFLLVAGWALNRPTPVR
ncbi:MAG: apolipoprotein N-acyltransferase [Myxococcota bacterium]